MLRAARAKRDLAYRAASPLRAKRQAQVILDGPCGSTTPPGSGSDGKAAGPTTVQHDLYAPSWRHGSANIYHFGCKRETWWA
eukprot:7590165-Pyramimonas_sp.AAC.1